MIFKEMNMMEIQEVYNNHLVNDFHSDEIKPLAIIEHMYNVGIYRAIGMYNDDILLAYAFIANVNEVHFIDYYAVCNHANRGKGYGTTFLTYLNDKFDNILAEVEDPSFAKNTAQKNTMDKRVEFYVKNKYRITDVKGTVFGVHYKLMCNNDWSDSQVKKGVDDVYKMMLNEEIYKSQVKWD